MNGPFSVGVPSCRPSWDFCWPPLVSVHLDSSTVCLSKGQYCWQLHSSWCYSEAWHHFVGAVCCGRPFDHGRGSSRRAYAEMDLDRLDQIKVGWECERLTPPEALIRFEVLTELTPALLWLWLTRPCWYWLLLCCGICCLVMILAWFEPWLWWLAAT